MLGSTLFTFGSGVVLTVLVMDDIRLRKENKELKKKILVLKVD